MTYEPNNPSEDEGCGIEETCAMDVNAVLSEDKNKELMDHALSGLDDLL